MNIFNLLHRWLQRQREQQQRRAFIKRQAARYAAPRQSQTRRDTALAPDLERRRLYLKYGYLSAKARGKVTP